MSVKYEDEICQPFNDELDDAGDIEIANIVFKRSRILYEFATETYQDAFNEYLENEFNRLKDIVYNDYPACIAYNFRLSEKGEGSADPVRKLLHLKDSWEAIVFISYAIVMGEIRQKRTDLRNAQVFISLDPGGNPVYGKFNTDRILSEAVKQKAQNIKSLIQYSKAKLLGFKFEEIEEKLLDDLLALQDIRNDISHHATPTREEAEAELSQVIPLFQQMLTKTRFLENCKILRFESFAAEFRCEVFNGHSLNREFDVFKFVEPQRSYILGLGQEQIFVLWDAECFSLSPFLHFTKDAAGHESHLCFYKRRHESKFWYEPVKTRKDMAFDALQVRFDAEKDDIVSLLVP